MLLELGKPACEIPYHPIDGKGGDIAWHIPQNWVVTLRLLHQWNKHDTDYRPWYQATRVLLNMFSNCPIAAILWNHLTGILNELPGIQDLTKELTVYGCRWLDTSEHHLANYLLVLAKATIYKTYMAVYERQRPTHTYHQIIWLGIQYHLYVDYHHRISKISVKRFSAFWPYKELLGKIYKGQSILSNKLEGENAWTLELRYVNQTAFLISPWFMI
jgi:hypothetical protein